MNVFGIVSGFFAAQPMSVSPGVEPAQAARESVAAGISPDGCTCGAAQRCDPFADIPMGLPPDAEWLVREDARLDKLSRLTRRHGSRLAALRMFARPAVMPPREGSAPP